MLLMGRYRSQESADEKAAITWKHMTTAMARCRPRTSPKVPPTNCPTIIPAMSEDVHKDCCGTVIFRVLSIMVKARLILTVLYAVDQLDSMARRISAAVLLRLLLYSSDPCNGLEVNPSSLHHDDDEGLSKVIMADS